MYNKYKPWSSPRTGRQNHQQPFEISLTDFQGSSPAPLSYSHTHNSPRIIALEHLPHRDQIYPPITDFEAQTAINSSRCNRRDCIDRKFRAIQTVNKASPIIKAVSPHKKDIIFEEEHQMPKQRKNPCIHSVKQIGTKTATEKDLLKQFRQIQQARKELKTRKYLRDMPASMSVNLMRNSRSVQLNPQKGNLYLEVKTRISRRYNSMFRKYAQSFREDLRNKSEILKGVCSARSIHPNKLKPN